MRSTRTHTAMHTFNCAALFLSAQAHMIHIIVYTQILSYLFDIAFEQVKPT